MIYLNYAALCPIHSEVAREVEQTLTDFRGYLYSDAGIEWYGHTIQTCRQHVATFLQVPDPSSIAFTSNASMALHLTLASLNWKANDIVLTTTHENPSITRQLFAFEQRGVRIQPLNPGSPEALIHEIERHLKTNQVQALVMSHVSHVDGRILPIHAISTLARSYTCLVIIDGAQAVGQIPVDLKALDYDVYFFPGHKWCQGPLGTGAMIVKDRLFTHPRYHPIQMERQDWPKASRFEIGTHNIGLMAGLAQACERINKEGMGTESLQAFQRQAKDILGHRQDLTISEWDGPHAPGIMTIRGRAGFDHRRFTRRLADEFRIIVKPFVDYPEDILPAIRLSWIATMRDQDFHMGLEKIAEGFSSQPIQHADPSLE